jgi:hypothetical protein
MDSIVGKEEGNVYGKVYVLYTLGKVSNVHVCVFFLFPDVGTLDNCRGKHRHVNIYGKGPREETTVPLFVFLLLRAY